MERKVSAATQNQALNALVFMYRHVLNQPFENLDGLVYAKRKINIPTVLTQGAHLLERGCDIFTVQEQLGHKDIRNTHVLKQRGKCCKKPIE